MNRRKHFDSGHGNPEYSFPVIDYGDGRYMMHAKVGSKTVASVDFDELSSEEDRPSVAIGHLRSHEEGKGHARRLIQNLYDRYGDDTIVDWGFTVHPAATHLAEQFSAKYPHRTDFIESDN